MVAGASLLDQLADLSRHVQAVHERRAGEEHVSPSLARLLGLLCDRSPTMNELAALLDLDKSSTSGLVDRAQRRGLVRRVPSQLDRRSVRVRLTPDGSDLTARLAARIAADLEAMLEPVPEEDGAAFARSLSVILGPR